MEKEKSRFTFPCVTLEQMLAFDIDDPETWTPSPLINAFLDAMEHVRPINFRTIGRYVGLEAKELRYGLHAMTGLSFREFMELWRKSRFYRLLSENPSIPPKMMASQLLFASQGALWTFLTRNKMIEPLTWHWNLPKHMKLREEVEGQFEVDDSRQRKVQAELRRRKWEELLTNKK